MASLEDLIARQKEMSGQLSTQTRTVALGFLAFAWALLTAHDDPLKTMAANAGQSLLIGLCAFAVGVLLCDSFQYYFGSQSAKETIARLENSGASDVQYDSSSFSYRMQWGMYYLKQFLLILGFVLMVITFVRLFKTPAKSPAPAPPAAVACVPVCCNPPAPPPPPAPPVPKPHKRHRKPCRCASAPSDKGGQPES